jgi:hypothetical protein
MAVEKTFSRCQGERREREYGAGAFSLKMTGNSAIWVGGRGMA